MGTNSFAYIVRGVALARCSTDVRSGLQDGDGNRNTP